MMFVQFNLVRSKSFIIVFYLCLQIKTITKRKKTTSPPPLPPPNHPTEMGKSDKLKIGQVEANFFQIHDQMNVIALDMLRDLLTIQSLLLKRL